MAIRHSITLSTTEPNNEVGNLKIRQGDEQTQTLVVQIAENGIAKPFTGLQPFFCAKLGQTVGLGIVEQKVTGEINPANGTLEYVMQPEDWQKIGRQTGYFSFRKMKNAHEWTEQFSTRDFAYNVIPSAIGEVTEVKKDGSTYVWTIEDMLRLFKEYIATGKNDWENYKNDERTTWEKFVEDNREFLETADPGGKIILELLGARDGAQTLGERLDSDKAQTTYTTENLIGVKGKSVAPLEKGIVSFFTDDGFEEDYTVYKDIFATAGVPCCTGLITSKVGTTGYATLSQLKELQDDYGWEIGSHSHTHLHLAQLTEQQIDDNLRLSKEWLVSNGFKGECLAYPYGSYDNRVKKIARKYFRSARSSKQYKDGYNPTPLPTYELYSVWFEVNNYTVADYKAFIDKARDEKKWLILSFHSSDLTNNVDIPEILDYAKANCDVLTFSQALDKVGNIIDVGDGEYNERFAVSHDGVPKSQYQFVGNNKFDGNSVVHDFDKSAVTVSTVNFATANASGLPGKSAGTLITHKYGDNATTILYTYQMYYTNSKNEVYRRVLKSDNTWDVWEEVESLTRIKTSFTTSNLIADFPLGVTMTPLTVANASGVPLPSAGMLVTFKVSLLSPYNYQEFKVHDGVTTYKRSPKSDGSWGDWKEVSSRDTYPNINGVDGNTSITTMNMGVTYNPVDKATATASGLPESLAGTLVTYKIHGTDHNYNYQTYHVHGTAKMYKRSFNTTGTPIAWTKISVV